MAELLVRVALFVGVGALEARLAALLMVHLLLLALKFARGRRARSGRGLEVRSELRLLRTYRKWRLEE
eukprot:15429608-Alexandrium_andersonii.AAC.1